MEKQPKATGQQDTNAALAALAAAGNSFAWYAVSMAA